MRFTHVSMLLQYLVALRSQAQTAGWRAYHPVSQWNTVISSLEACHLQRDQSVSLSLIAPSQQSYKETLFRILYLASTLYVDYTSRLLRFTYLFWLLAQLVRASPTGLCRAERTWFEPWSEHQLLLFYSVFYYGLLVTGHWLKQTSNVNL